MLYGSNKNEKMKITTTILSILFTMALAAQPRIVTDVFRAKYRIPDPYIVEYENNHYKVLYNFGRMYLDDGDSTEPMTHYLESTFDKSVHLQIKYYATAFRRRKKVVTFIRRHWKQVLVDHGIFTKADVYHL
jgi:hypothetical protein